LYYANRSAEKVKEDLIHLLETSPDVYISCILGKKFRYFYPKLKALQSCYGRRLRLRGWTQRIPEYLQTHHLLIGKAGGATVHEALAAARPMLVNYLLFGQEEGNAALLERLGGGFYAGSGRALSQHLQELLADQGQRWRDMQHRLTEAGYRHGSERIAELILDKIKEQYQ
jgi:processive 1,2-diacylglycerol beta-glucosyltransferase